MFDLWTPLGGDVLEGGGTDDGEADEEDVSLRVGERAQPVVVLLARRVPQAERHRHPVTNHRGAVVVKPAQEHRSSFLFTSAVFPSI